MKGSIWEGGYIYAWRCLHSNKAVYNSGAKMGVIISFETSASFVLDNGVSGLENLRYLPVVSLIPGPISVENVKIVRRT